MLIFSIGQYQFRITERGGGNDGNGGGDGDGLGGERERGYRQWCNVERGNKGGR